MSRIRTLTRPAGVLLALVTVIASTHEVRGAEARRHTHLVKSEPADHDTMASSPRAIRLWFTEQVELAVTTVKLADAAGSAVALAPLARPDSGEHAPVVAAIGKSLAPGAYVITWSTAAKDGHPSKGTIGFLVKAAR